ncbi:hypothetical protein Ocin01_18836, partial [Orchesella cincta]
ELKSFVSLTLLPVRSANTKKNLEVTICRLFLKRCKRLLLQVLGFMLLWSFVPLAISLHRDFIELPVVRTPPSCMLGRIIWKEIYLTHSTVIYSTLCSGEEGGTTAQNRTCPSNLYFSFRTCRCELTSLLLYRSQCRNSSTVQQFMILQFETKSLQRNNSYIKSILM